MERAVQNLDFGSSEIERACRDYFEERGSLQRFELLSGGAVNSTFKVLWDKEWLVLRFSLRDKHLAEVERAIYQLVQKKVPVPETLFTSSGNEPYPFAIFRFYDRPHLFDVDKVHSSALSYDLGKILAKIHSFHFPLSGLFKKGLSIGTPFEEGSSPYLDYCLEHLIESSLAWKRLGGARAERVRKFIEKHHEFFPRIVNGGVLVHSDFKPVNLLWEEERGLLVLDWEFAHSGHGLIDFGILLRHYQDFPLEIHQLEEGYRENGGELVSDWIQRARIADFINIIQLLDVPAERPKLFHSLIKSVEFTIDNWQNLSNATW